MNSISANLNIMIKASEKASKILIRDFGEIENLQVSKKGPKDFVTNSDLKTEKIIISELKKAYRELAKKHHPDKVQNLGEVYVKAAKEKFSKIQAAYENIKKQRGI